MATRIETTLIDDLDGTEAAETITFDLDGKSYEIDLSQPNADALRSSLAPFVSKARRAGGRRQTGTSALRSISNTKQIRAWAEEQGIKVNSRGRLNSDVLEAYEKAHTSN
ncbi:Lsr2 family protein [Paenarthrobacter sp. NPDC090522]|uniref:histone-like nucleoid-structuring protein Lsr2 n=1 Tax=Paenarthrobacter sp. NPDC090522 TaxID=3364383 RepID=UPI0038205A7A